MGKITTPSGMSYRLLALDPNSQQMSLPVLKKIRDLVKAGAMVTGPKPTTTLSLSDDQAEFQTIVNELWTVDKGENTLEIKVTNLWVNRLIGDQQPGVTKKFTYTTMPFYRANSPLLPSGLLGPVRIISLSAM